MARAVGVELTESLARILWLEQTGKRARILHFSEVPLPADAEKSWEARASGALAEAFSAAGVPKGRVVAAIDSGDAILRQVSLPFKGDEQIRKTVRYEMESQIHNYTIEQLVVCWYKTGETEKGTVLLAAAVPKQVIEKRLKVFQEAGLDPLALDLDVAAIFNAMLHAGAIQSDEPHLLIHGTSKFTKLVFIEGRQPRSIRTIRFSMPQEAGPPPSRRPAPPPAAGKEFGEEAIVVLSEEQARQFSELDQEAQGALVEILAKEISRFLLATAASASPSHILLSGEFEDERAARLLEAATEIPVRRFNLLEAVDHPFEKTVPGESSRLGVALGLALKGAGVDALGMDFRQDEFQYRKKFEAVKTTALVTVELVIVFLAAIALHFYFRSRDLRDGLKTVLGHQADLHTDATGESVADPLMAYPKMKELYAKCGSGPVDTPLKVTARQAWRDLFEALQGFQRTYGPQQLGDGPLHVEIESLDIVQSTTAGNESLTMTLRGKVRNIQYAEAMKNEIRAKELFRNADWSAVFNPTADGFNQFTLKATKGGRGG